MNEARIFRLLIMPLLGPRGTGPLIFSFSLLMNGYFWDSEQAGWIRPGLPPLCMMTGPFSIFVGPFGRPGNIKQLLICSNGKGFGVVFGFDVYGSHHLLVSSHLRERDKMLLRAILSFWGSLELVKLRKKTFLVGSVVHLTKMVTCFGIALFLPLLSFAISLSFL